jgi:hypothetical protein
LTNDKKVRFAHAEHLTSCTVTAKRARDSQRKREFEELAQAWTSRIVSGEIRLAIRLMCGNTVLKNNVLPQEMAEDLQDQPVPPAKGATTNFA